MLFNSIHYLVFLPIVATAYYTLPLPLRRPFLLASSFYFYCVFSIPLSLLLVWSTILDYTAARAIDAYRDRPGVAKAAVTASVVGNLATLGVFKYLDFLNESVEMVTGSHAWPMLDIVLPMGISFYTFQTMSYTIDVYRGRCEARRSLLDVALYVSFFPQLVAGPIMRGTDLLPQFAQPHRPRADQILSGSLLCVWGLLKKVFIADPMGTLVDSVFGTAARPMAPEEFSGLALLVATYAFAIQIYCDFSAYTDIARGSGRILGFRLMENFRAPYLATTIRDFWRRWHISLSTWLRDYLYVTLGGSRVSVHRTYVNLAVTMLLGGLWHGAAWTFVVWGGLHGLYLAGERALGIDRLDPMEMKQPELWLRRIITFHLVCLAWVFFRAESGGQAFAIVWRIVFWAQGDSITAVPVLVLISLLVVQAIKRRYVHLSDGLLTHPNVARWIVYASLAMLVPALVGGRTPEFIYFQF